MWFRRDLRLGDNPALADAAADGEVAGLFVVDPVLWGPAGSNRRAFLARTIEHLDRSTGGAVHLRLGDPVREVVDYARRVGAERVVAAADFGPYGRRRDAEVAAALDRVGLHLDRVGSPYAVAPGSISTRSGTPYKVFTPFYREWAAHGWERPIPAPAVSWVPRPPGDGEDVWGELRVSLPEPHATLPEAGEAAALAAAEEFLEGPVDRYDVERDRPGCDATSRLSPYLKWGCVHPRQLLARLAATKGQAAFRRQLAWRDFYADVLFHDPDSARRAWVPKMRAMRTDDGAGADRLFSAWAEGRTGYPLVDAGMRQLRAEGWMHNRVRMLVASFLVKDLHISWDRGARHFMRHLVDGDIASNSHGWQWVAGTGTDASPWFRVFNPITQSERFDPDGTYISRWVPELAGLEGRLRHRPWDAPGGPPPGYPAPIVDHAEERAEALRRLDELG
jgi:deoxyribodipyrimidine photo-lyase